MALSSRQRDRINRRGLDVGYRMLNEVKMGNLFAKLDSMYGSSSYLMAPVMDGSYGYVVKFHDSGSSAGSHSTSGAAQKCYSMSISTNRSSAYAVTGDSNDAVLKLSHSNYAANDANFIARGINAIVQNKSGGVAGQMDNTLAAKGNSGGTLSQIRALQLVPENYGTCSDEFGGLDIVMKNEGAKATLEYGIRIRNLDNSTASAVDSAILVLDSGTNTGFSNLLDASSATLDHSFKWADGQGAVVGSMAAGHPGAINESGYVKIYIGATPYVIPVYAAA